MTLIGTNLPPHSCFLSFMQFLLDNSTQNITLYNKNITNFKILNNNELNYICGDSFIIKQQIS